MSDPIGVSQFLSSAWGPGRRAYVFVDVPEGQPPVHEPICKGQCWALTAPKDMGRRHQCQNFARSVGAGVFCTCATHRKHEAAARKLKAELGSTK